MHRRQQRAQAVAEQVAGVDEAQQRRLVQGVNEAARENINRMARDEMRTPAHVDVTEDRSVTGPTRTIADPRPRESAK